MSVTEPTVTGVSEKTHAKLKRLKEDGHFREMADAYRFAIGLALAQGINAAGDFFPNSLQRGHHRPRSVDQDCDPNNPGRSGSRHSCLPDGRAARRLGHSGTRRGSRER